MLAQSSAEDSASIRSATFSGPDCIAHQHCSVNPLAVGHQGQPGHRGPNPRSCCVIGPVAAVGQPMAPTCSRIQVRGQERGAQFSTAPHRSSWIR